MRKLVFLLLALILTRVPATGAEGAPAVDPMNFTFRVLPAELGLRWDDNVFRSAISSGIWPDFVHSLDLGGSLESRWKDWKGVLEYRFGGDLYQTYDSLDDAKNSVDLALSVKPGEFNFSYKKEYFIRDSHSSDFYYFDDDNSLSLQWVPSGVWSSELQFKDFSRVYFDSSDSFQARNFMDLGGLLKVRREINDSFSLEGSVQYNTRQFNRNVVIQNSSGFVSQPTFPLQTDQTWSVLLGTHFYLVSILQEVQLEEQRTDSNSYGFSNRVQSLSWASVVSPVHNFYLQLFFRLYDKKYDASPLFSPDLQVGFIDEDSQDLLSAKASWEFSTQWTVDFGVSRLRTETTQPGLYYNKNLLSAQVRLEF